MAKILIIGVGSAGTNAIRRMKEVGIPNADYIAISTDKVALIKVEAETGIKGYNLCSIFEEKYGCTPQRYCEKYGLIEVIKGWFHDIPIISSKFLAEQCEEEISAIIDSHLSKPKGE